MAGRGTDIAIHENAVDLGGLHVINFQINDSSRVDRQLFGRTARQGDPGSCQAILNLSDDLVLRELPLWIYNVAVSLLKQNPRLGEELARVLISAAQFRAERKDAKQRLEAFNRWPKLDRQLGFSGDME